MRLAFVLALLGACAVEAPEPVMHTCVVTYRCAGAPEMAARVGLPCASSEEEAEHSIREDMIAEMPEACPQGWASVQARCDVYEVNDAPVACEVLP